MITKHGQIVIEQDEIKMTNFECSGISVKKLQITALNNAKQKIEEALKEIDGRKY